jgi:hypothetical protein
MLVALTQSLDRDDDEVLVTRVLDRVDIMSEVTGSWRRTICAAP